MHCGWLFAFVTLYVGFKHRLVFITCPVNPAVFTGLRAQALCWVREYGYCGMCGAVI